MEQATNSDDLWDLAVEFKAKGIKGMLISGGSDSSGAVPILPFLDIIKKIKIKLNICINLHTGLIKIEDIPKLVEKGIDVISFDIVGSPDALLNVYGLEVELDYFDRALAAFNNQGLRVVPHITVGLDRGNDSGEAAALRLLAAHEPHFVVINALMSSEGSEKAAARLPEVLRLARDILPENTSIGVGCMRPRGDWLMANYLAKVNSIALPSKALLKGLAALGIETCEHEGCCAFY